jgi:hypothetical protein
MPLWGSCSGSDHVCDFGVGAGTLSQLDEANRGAAAGAANMIAFRVTGEDGQALAKCFDTTPTQQIIGEEPERAPVSDVVSHLVKRGHSDARVTRFAHHYLQKFEDFIEKWKAYQEYLSYTGINHNVQAVCKARRTLNEVFYRCMSTGSAEFSIEPFVLYALAVTISDGSEEAFEPYVMTSFLIRDFKGFFKEAGQFGEPRFVTEAVSQRYIQSRKKKEREAVQAAITMIKELRYTMKTLADFPVMVDTGQYIPKYQDRTYADMENEIARNLTQQPNFQARAKMLSGEHDIRTNDAPVGLSESGLAARMREIKAHMRAPDVGICRHYSEVAQEIRERQGRWRNGGETRSAGGPPPAHT